MFIEYCSIEASKRFIQTANGEKVGVSGIGKVMMKVDVKGNMSDLVLKNVLHVPDANFQLISLSSLVNSGCKINLDREQEKLLRTQAK